MKRKNAKLQMLKSGIYLHFSILFRTFALSNNEG